MSAPQVGAVNPGDDEGQSPPIALGLLAKLVAAVRPEFRDEVLVFDPDDSVFGGAICRVPSCGRVVIAVGLCGGHHQRWAAQGRPGLDHFAAMTSPLWKGQHHPSCRVQGCQYGGATQGLCHNHYVTWKTAGRTPPDAWAAAQPAALPQQPPRTCLVTSCDLWAHAELPLCFPHDRRWRRHQEREGTADIDEFVRGCDTDRRDNTGRVDLRPLQPQMRLEVQYALQCRRDENKAKTWPMTAGMVARFLAGTTAHSLLDHSDQQWVEQLMQPQVKGASASARGLLIYARRQVEDLAYGHGWDVEYPRDVWRLHTLGVAGPIARLRFDRIPQPWLRALAKRWSRWRLSSGISSTHAYSALAAVSRFAAFLNDPSVGVGHLTDIDRAVLERYLAFLHTHMGGEFDHGRNVSYLNGFFQAIRRHGWDEGALPATAVFFPEDHPKAPLRLPRSLADHVMAQVEDPANLDQWTDPTGRLLTVTLIRCGLRITDGARLTFDCVVHDGDGAPYLRYFNHKMKREALVPIDEELHQMIKDHQRRILQHWPDGIPVLFPRPNANANGNSPIGGGTYRRSLHHWLKHCDIRDEHGLPVHLTPHQWRHTLVISLA